MPDLVVAFRDFFTPTMLDAMVAAIGILTAGVGWVLGMNRRARKAPALRGAADAYEDWNGQGGLIFPADGDSRRFEPDDVRPADSMFVESMNEIGASGGRIVEAVRERPLEFLAGALAAGFAAGLLLPIFSNRNHQTRLLERLVEVSEKSRRTQAQRGTERFRQARPK
jgi:hypothetical protein